MSTVDNDEHGLYDVLEHKGMILSNGNTIFTDLFKVDTDGDGLIDGLEIRLKKRNYVYHCFEFEIVDGVNPLLLLYSLLILYYYCYTLFNGLVDDKENYKYILSLSGGYINGYLISGMFFVIK